MKAINLELWADSFHEGDWACNHLGAYLKQLGYKVDICFKWDFIPVYSFKDETTSFCITVFGSYRSWKNLPDVISTVLDWGKPDFILYNPEKEAIVFAVEETAAVPTGNQALQRCERMYGALRQKIPFWYLISEYGQHIDGGVRRDSIWPTIMALKLTCHMATPCVVLHYSDSTNPEDYDSGIGMSELFSCLGEILINVANHCHSLRNLKKHLRFQYAAMLNFVKNQWKNIVSFIPGENLLDSEDLPGHIADIACGLKHWDSNFLPNFLVWPKFSGLPDNVRVEQTSQGLIKYDPLCELLEKDLESHKAYSLSGNAGSRPQPKDSVDRWLLQQRKIFNKMCVMEPPAEYSAKISDFPESQSGLLHITTAKNIVYLYDAWRDLKVSIEKAYPRLKNRLPKFKQDQPVIVYVSNSLKPGRLFGDPYTGQIAAFATAFGKMDPNPRLVLAYFPHQAHPQAVIDDGSAGNKGLTLMSELTDLLLFAGGVAIELCNNEVI